MDGSIRCRGTIHEEIYGLKQDPKATAPVAKVLPAKARSMGL
jgi:hypothetical protein